MKKIKKAVYFVNSSGENNNLQHFTKSIVNNPFTQGHILALDEELPSYTNFPVANRKDRLEEIIKNSNTFEIKQLNSHLNLGEENNFETTRLKGRFPLAVSDWANSNDVDLFIKESIPCDGEYGLASKGDIKLTRQLNSPLLLIHSKINLGDPILAAIPPVFEDNSGLELATDVLQNAIDWALRLKAPLKILRVWELFGESLLSNRVSLEELKDSLNLEQKKWKEDLEKVFKNVNIPKEIDSEILFHKGDPTRIIQATVDMIRPSLVVIGSVANDGAKAALLGNTAESIMRKKDVSVLLLKKV